MRKKVQPKTIGNVYTGILNNRKGITLMALIVTIIVLLILAGISISMLAGNNGIINKAIEARDSTEIAGIIEEVKMAILEKQMENLGNLTSGDLKDVLDEYFSDVPVTLPEDETELAELELTTIDGKHTIKVGDIWTGSLSELPLLPSNEETTPYLPSSDFSQVAGTDLSTGLVIEDNLGNQYVWIEVPRTESVYPTAGLNITEGVDGKFTETEYTTIEEDLHTYVTTYRSTNLGTDTWYSEEQTGLTETEYNNLKQTMLQSVYRNGGFWIGRYETGIENSFRHYDENDDTEHPITETPVIKANAYPYNWLRCSQAQQLASQMNSGNYTSSLMFGVQWDLVLKYLEVKAVEKGAELATIQSELDSNSTSWGNHYDSTYNITNTLAKYTSNYGNSWLSCPYNKERSSGVILSTGASNIFSKQNIYDLAGNVWEFTLAYSRNASRPCSSRGGSCGYDGSQYPAGSYASDTTTTSIDLARFSYFNLLSRPIS